MSDRTDETHQTVSERQPGDGVEISAARARQGYSGPISRRLFWILVISCVAAVALLFGYWASISGGLHRIDTAGADGGQAAYGQRVGDPEVASQFQAPAPAPKAPSSDAIRQSQGESPGG